MKTIWACLFAVTAISPLETAEVNRLRLMTFNILQGGGDARTLALVMSYLAVLELMKLRLQLSWRKLI